MPDKSLSSHFKLTAEAIDLAARECHAWMSEGLEEWHELDDDQRVYFRRMGESVLVRAVNAEVPK